MSVISIFANAILPEKKWGRYMSAAPPGTSPATQAQHRLPVVGLAQQQREGLLALVTPPTRATNRF